MQNKSHGMEFFIESDIHHTNLHNLRLYFLTRIRYLTVCSHAYVIWGMSSNIFSHFVYYKQIIYYKNFEQDTIKYDNVYVILFFYY